MDEIKAVSEDSINYISGETGFNTKILLKDYYLTTILYLIKDIKGVYFKGGTALQKIFLDYSRLSEDIDFTVDKDIKEIINEIIKILEESNIFERITKDKDVEGFTRLVVHYKGFSNEEGVVFIDLNKRAKLLMGPESHKIKHFYKGIIPDFSINTLAQKEMIAEKVAAAIGRNKPRDHFDIYMLLKKKFEIDIQLVKEKCRQSNVEFNIIRMFDKAKKLKKRWDDDVIPLLAEEATFEEVMKVLAKHFKLKEEKDKMKKTPDKEGLK